MDTSLWMARDLLVVVPDTTLIAATKRMAERRVRHLLVVAADDPTQLVGIVSSHDLYLAADAGIHPLSPRAVDRERRTVGELMTPHPFSIPSNTSIATAARILRDKKFGCLPVVDRGALVGILTEHDILRAFLSMSGADQSGYEVTCVVNEDDNVLDSMNTLATQRGLRLTSASVFDHEGKRYGVVHFVGKQSDAFVESLWRSGHKILRVQASEPEAALRPVVAATR
jgi:acetoin utilization protein AcuB